MSEMITVGDAIARTLEQYQVEAIYGVISIHNLPIADAVGQRGNIRFVPARGEAGIRDHGRRPRTFFRSRRGADQHRCGCR